jgi:hypothetical protein
MSSFAGIYKCNVDGVVAYQSKPCKGIEEKSSPIIKEVKKTNLNHCITSFNECLSTLNLGAYESGKEYCNESQTYCEVSPQKDLELTLRHLKRTKKAKLIYTKEVRALKKEASDAEHQAKIKLIDDKYNQGVAERAEKSYERCFESAMNDYESDPLSKKSVGTKISIERDAKKKCTALKRKEYQKWSR